MSGSRTDVHADLHTHSTASDGALGPAELLARAAANGVTHLSITDHDTLAGYAGLSVPGRGLPELIPGIEFSTTWRKTGIHVVGLNLDLGSAALGRSVGLQTERRLSRARLIADRLRRAGVPVDFDQLLDCAGPSVIGRPHFADYLVREGHVRDVAAAFRRYLGSGRPGDVRSLWPEPGTAIGWILEAGGIPVLAHPAHYRLTTTRLRDLIGEFRAAGGLAMEVVCGRQGADTTRRLARLAAEFGLAASCGSDFHAPGGSWSEPGGFERLPEPLRPVWELWR